MRPFYQVDMPLFDGGLNTKANPTAIRINQSPDLNNVVFDDYGAVATRLGIATFNTNPIASAAIDGLAQYYKRDDTEYLMAVCGSSCWYATAGGTTFYTIASSQDLYTAGVNVDMLQFQDQMFLANGFQTPYKWNGSEFTRATVSAPTGTVSAVCNGTGALSGSYTWAFTAVNSNNVESDYGVLAATAAIAAGQVNLSDIPTFPASYGINDLFIYRNTANAEGVYYRVTAITNGVSAWTDNVADTSILTAAPTDNGPMPLLKYMTVHQGRIFGAGNATYPDYLYFSEANTPEKWPSTNFIRVGDGDGQDITGLRTLGNSLAIFKNTRKGKGDTYLLHTPDSADVTGTGNWYLFKAPTEYGAASHRAISFFNNMMFYMNRWGFYAFTGADIARAAADSVVGRFGVDSQSFDIEPDVYDINTSLIENVAAFNYDNKVWVAVPRGSTATKNNTVYVFDFERASEQSQAEGAWSKFADKNISQFAEFNGSLYGGSSDADGYVYQLNVKDTYNDGGSAIDSYFKTAVVSGLPEHRDHYKLWRYVYLLIEAVGSWNMDVTYFRDYTSGIGTIKQISCSNDSANWGSLKWGVNVWGAGVAKKRVRIALQNMVSKEIQFKFSTNTADQWFKVHSAQLKYTLRGLRG